MLLIEDDADYALIVNRYLANAEKEGINFCVENAARLSDALELPSHGLFDIILSDLGLPTA